MTSKTQTLDSLPAAARDAAKKARRILVVTGESDDEYARTRAAAFDIAAETGAEVILYDHSAESHFVDPYLAGPVAADVGVPLLVVGADGAIGVAESDGKPADAPVKS